MAVHVAVSYVHDMKYQLMPTINLSASRLFPTGDSSNNKGWWRFICFDMFEVPPASLTAELHCLYTATSASVGSTGFRLRRLNFSFLLLPDIRFSLVFGTRMYSILRLSAMFIRSSFSSGNFGTFRK